MNLLVPCISSVLHVSRPSAFRQTSRSCWEISVFSVYLSPWPLKRSSTWKALPLSDWLPFASCSLEPRVRSSWPRRSPFPPSDLSLLVLRDPVSSPHLLQHSATAWCCLNRKMFFIVQIVPTNYLSHKFHERCILSVSRFLSKSSCVRMRLYWLSKSIRRLSRSCCDLRIKKKHVFIRKFIRRSNHYVTLELNFAYSNPRSSYWRMFETPICLQKSSNVVSSNMSITLLIVWISSFLCVIVLSMTAIAGCTALKQCGY